MMENKEIMWKVVGAIALVSMIGSFSFIYSVYTEIKDLTPRDSSVLEEVFKALRKTDSSYASER